MPFHNHLDPIAFSIGPIAVHWYGIGFAVIFGFGEWFIGKLLVREGRHDIETDRLLLYALGGTVLGARIVHCAFYDPQYYLTYPWKIFAVWEGGLASHGGVIGLVLALMWANRASPRGTLMYLLDRISIPAAIGGGLVRLANFVNSEILGLPTDGPFAVVFDAIDAVPRHPVQLYEAACYFVLGLLLASLYFRTPARNQPGLLTGVFFVGVFSARLLLERYKVPQAAFEGAWWISMGQVLSLPFIGVGLLLALLPSSRKVH